jgi:stage III sporulation protein AB
MIIRLGGIIAVFIACSAAGLIKSCSLSKRVRDLESFLSALSLISTEIRYFASPTDQIMAKLGAADEYARLMVFGACRANLEQTRDFARAWDDAIAKAQPFLSLDKGDIEALKDFGGTFGTTDAEGQTANCERYCELLRYRLEIAREDRAKRGRMYSSLGVLSGVFFALIFY